MAFFRNNNSSLRTQKMEAVAQEIGLQFKPIEDFNSVPLLEDFVLFKKGIKKRISNIIYKKDDWNQAEVKLFDYRYTISSGKSSRTYKQTVFFMNSRLLGLPHFMMKPEHFLHKIGTFLGMQDIDFEAFPEFSDQYLLKGKDEDFIRHKMTDDILQFFTIEKHWSLEGVNFLLIFYRNKKLLSPSQIKAFYKKGLAINKMLSE